MATYALILLLCAAFVPQTLCKNRPVVFAVMGDWGWGPDGDYTRLSAGRNLVHAQGQIAASKAMGYRCSVEKCKFVINTGDNFYDLGIDSSKGCYDPQWNTSFNDIYNHPSLTKLKFYGVLGNHEYGLNGTGPNGRPHSIYPQIEYTVCDPMKRWYIPNRFYNVDVPEKNQKIRITVIDTSPFINGYCTNPNSKYHTPEMLQLCQTDIRRGDLDHFDKSTAEANSKKYWNIAVGHHPIYGSYGPNQPYHDIILPIMQKNRPNLYFAGHDHISAHLKYGNLSNTNLFVIGNSGITDDGSLPQPGFDAPYVFSSKSYGFAIVKLFDDYGYIYIYGVKDINAAKPHAPLLYKYKFDKYPKA